MAVQRRGCWISAMEQLQRKPHKFFDLRCPLRDTLHFLHVVDTGTQKSNYWNPEVTCGHEWNMEISCGHDWKTELSRVQDQSSEQRCSEWCGQDSRVQHKSSQKNNCTFSDCSEDPSRKERFVLSPPYPFLKPTSVPA